MTPCALHCVAAFVGGMGVGVLMLATIVLVERRAAIRRRLQAPPFTTPEGGR